jgi:hypothetical protein
MNLSQLEEVMKSLADLKSQQHTEASEMKNLSSVSEKIQLLQDQLINEFGAVLEEAIFNVHDEYCPDDDMRALTEYLPRFYQKEGKHYVLPIGEGVLVEADDYPGQPVRLALSPNPVRLVMKVQESGAEEVLWVASDLVEA